MTKHCETCTCEKKPVTEVHVVEGIQWKKHTWPNGGTTIDAPCWCCGDLMHTHNTIACPWVLKRTLERAQEGR